jgi:MGT family glycosyltransferase
MEKQHIAVFTPFFAGHVYPALGLCTELVRRGHRVTFPTNSLFAARVRDAGAEAIEIRIPEIKHAERILQDTSSDGSGYWRLFTVASPVNIMRAAASAAELEEFYAANRPDVILYDWFAFAGRILGKHLGCPAIQIHAHFAHHHDSLMRVDGVCTNPETMVAFAHLLDAFMSTYGFEGKSHLWHFEQLNIFFIPREFQYDPDAFDSRFRFVGATHNRNRRAGAWKNRVGDGKPLLLITENTASMDETFLKLCIEAFAESPYHVVFSKGLNSPEVSSELLPHNFEINRKVFNCEILPFANVMVCQGSMGSTLEALYHGVPVVAIPSNPYNSEVSYRLAELGLGLHLPARNLTSSALREAIDIAYSDDTLLKRVKRMQDGLKDTPSAKLAADAVEEFLADTRIRQCGTRDR